MNKEALSQLSHFTGTEQYHRHIGALVYSDGVKFLCDNADCYWLLDIIWSYLPACTRDSWLRSMQFWTLKLGRFTDVKPPKAIHFTKTNEETTMAHVICERDSGDIAIVQDIAFSDFPFDTLPEAKIWVAPTYLGDRLVYVAYLPSEH